MSSLILLFVALPAIELYLLLELGSAIGALETFAIIFLTGALGASLVRSQGVGVLQQISHESSQGRMPALKLVEGLMLLLAGALLVTPGFLTDTLGFLTLVPPVRQWAAQHLAKRILTSSSSLMFYSVNHQGSPKAPPPGVIDVEAKDVNHNRPNPK